MFYIGCHLPSSKGYENMAKDAISIGANTFQFFTRNPRGGKAKAIDPTDIASFLSIWNDHQYGKIVAHSPYTLNPCSSDTKIRDFAYMIMADDLARMEYTPGNYYNFHPGSHVGQGMETGIQKIAEIMNDIMKPGQNTMVLLETMAGKGTEVGGRFEELREIIDRVTLSNKVGVCMDTCHISDAGYDIVHDLDGVFMEFDRIIGLDRLKAFHINDSVNPSGARKDRHARIGEGTIGFDAIIRFINHPVVKGRPCILETPNDDLTGYAEEISKLKAAFKV